MLPHRATHYLSLSAKHRRDITLSTKLAASCNFNLVFSRLPPCLSNWRLHRSLMKQEQTYTYTPTLTQNRHRMCICDVHLLCLWVMSNSAVYSADTINAIFNILLQSTAGYLCLFWENNSNSNLITQMCSCHRDGVTLLINPAWVLFICSSPRPCQPLTAVLHISCSGSGPFCSENGKQFKWIKWCHLWKCRLRQAIVSELTLLCCGDIIPWMKSSSPSLCPALPGWCRQLPPGSWRLSALKTACCSLLPAADRGSIR